MLLLNTQKYNRITYRYYIFEDTELKSSTYNYALAYILGYSTDKYKTSEIFNQALIALYDASLKITFNRVGELSYLLFEFSFLNPKLLNDKEYTLKVMYDEFMDIIFKPKVKEDAFSMENFKRYKNEVKNDLLMVLENPAKLSIRRAYMQFFKDTNASILAPGDEKIIKKITSKNLYSHYKEMLKKESLFVVCGDVLESDFDFVPKYEYTFSKIDHFIKERFIKEETKVIEKSNTKQTRLVIIYDYEEFHKDRMLYACQIFNGIFGGEVSSKLFKRIREELSLCYSIHSFYDTQASVFSVMCGIDKSNINKVILEIDNELSNIINGDFSDLDIDNNKLIIKNQLLKLEDQMNSIISHEITYLLIDDERFDIEKEIELVDSINKEDIIKIASTLHNKFTYILENDGEAHE